MLRIEFSDRADGRKDGPKVVRTDAVVTTVASMTHLNCAEIATKTPQGWDVGGIVYRRVRIDSSDSKPVGRWKKNGTARPIGQ